MSSLVQVRDGKVQQRKIPSKRLQKLEKNMKPLSYGSYYLYIGCNTVL